MCELSQGEYCSWESECNKHQEYLDSPAKVESDRRDAENKARIRDALDRGESPDPPF